MDTVNDSTAITVAQSMPLSSGMAEMMPIGSLAEFARMFEEFKGFITGQLKEGVDFGTTPGVDKPFLWQPGAEKIAMFFGMALDPQHVAGEVTPAYVSHTYCCRLISLRSGQVKATYEGSCNSAEKKIANLASKQGVSDMRALDNNIRKRAQKRSIVSAVRSGTAASQFFHAGSADHADDDEGDDNGNGHTAETRHCSLHNATMTMAISKKTGKPYWAHKNGTELCFGGKDDNKSAAPAQSSTPPASDAIPTDKVGRMNFITSHLGAINFTTNDLTRYVKENFQHSALSQCSDDELATLCAMVTKPAQAATENTEASDAAS